MEHRHAWFKFQDERVVKGRLVVFHLEELNVAFVPTTLLSYCCMQLPGSRDHTWRHSRRMPHHRSSLLSSLGVTLNASRVVRLQYRERNVSPACNYHTPSCAEPQCIYISRLVTGQFATRTFAPPDTCLPKITIADVCSLLRIQSYRVSVQVYG